MYLLRASLLALLSLTLSCGNLLNDVNAGRDGSAADDARAAFRYLDYMYNKDFGKGLNDQVFSGPLFEKYQEEIQKAINIKLRFPLNQIPSSSTKDSAASSISPADNWWEVGWWETAPEVIQENTGVVTSDDDSQGVIEFFRSVEGNSIINSYLDGIEERLQNLIDNVPDEFQGEINTALLEGGIISNEEISRCLTGIAAGASILNAVSIFSNMPLYSGRLVRISARIEQLQKNINIIEGGIDNTARLIFEHSIDADYSRVEEARVHLEEVYRHIERADNETASDYLTRELLTENTFGDKMAMAYFGATKTQEKVIEFINSDLAKVTVDSGVTLWSDCINSYDGSLYKTWYWSNLQKQKVTLKIFDNKANLIQSIKNSSFIGMSLQDINLMKRMSLARLSLLKRILYGGKLLEHCARFAQSDIDSMVMPLKEAVNDGIQHLLEDIESERLAIIALISNHISIPIKISSNLDGDIIYYNSRKCVIVDSINNEYMVKNYGRIVAREDSGTVIDLPTFIGKTEEQIRRITEPTLKERKDYLVAAAAELAEWEIYLRAHIAAGEDLP